MRGQYGLTRTAPCPTDDGTGEDAARLALEHERHRRDALARVQPRLWNSIAEESTDDWAKPMQRAAQAWAEHRTGKP
ncbi:hypothetical protein GCM10010313_46570 [Streptomyces violarus]|nr:hypothetical protein GCM10010313_46570 [Streptomyces violarus]